MNRDTIIKSRGRKTGFIATRFGHRCTSNQYLALCRYCQNAIRRDDSPTMRATKRIEWLKRQYRETSGDRSGILQTALLYMRERIAGTHSDWS